MSERETDVTWLLEAEVFPATHQAMREAVVSQGHEVVLWKDEWSLDESWPRLDGRRVVFHGSLGNADMVSQLGRWSPGAFCRTDAFRCSAWYPAAAQWLLHQAWVSTTVASLVADPSVALGQLHKSERIFVRPDSPLKPFSGRVLHLSEISLEALDHGFYYEDKELPIVVAPVCSVEREWRYVVVDRRVVAGSAYAAAGRAALPDDPNGAPWAFAVEVAQRLSLPESVLVLDVCESAGRLWLLELNPFSGADLYACNRDEVVRAVSEHVSQADGTRARHTELGPDSNPHHR